MDDGPEKPGPSGRQIYEVAVASIVGSIIEQYDFLITGVIAATIWGDVFFKLPKLAAAAAATKRCGRRKRRLGGRTESGYALAGT